MWVSGPSSVYHMQGSICEISPVGAGKLEVVGTAREEKSYGTAIFPAGDQWRFQGKERG